MTPRQPTCGTCPHCVLHAVGQGECHLEPPVLQILPARQGMEVVGIWRPVATSEPGCSHHPRWGEWAGRHAATIARDAGIEAASGEDGTTNDDHELWNRR